MAEVRVRTRSGHLQWLPFPYRDKPQSALLPVPEAFAAAATMVQMARWGQANGRKYTCTDHDERY